MLRVKAGTDLSWVGESLEAACRRLPDGGPRPEVVGAVYVPAEGRLLCVIAASGPDEVSRLFAMALLPSVRVIDVVVVEVGSGAGRSS
jgi:hypothetical protein